MTKEQELRLAIRSAITHLESYLEELGTGDAVTHDVSQTARVLSRWLDANRDALP